MNVERHPSPPRVRLRIGVSGHRAPPKLPAQSEAPLRAILDKILGVIVKTAGVPDGDFSVVQPGATSAEFVIVSSIAEGSDRIVANAGLAAGFALEVVLPFVRAEYARDFETVESRNAFEQLLGRAAAVFELDNVPASEERPRAYQAAGFVMLANIDLLIAIWDGAEAAGTGGTAQIVGRAVADGIPVIRIDPQKPDALQISWPQAGELAPARAYAQARHTFAPADDATVALVIRKILAPPEDAKRLLPQYLAEETRRWNYCPWYSLLLWIFAGRRMPLTDFRLPSTDAETRAQWDRYFSILPSDRAQRPAIETILLPAFSAADHLAIFYSLVYRSTYVFNFLFAAAAVALALAGVFIHDADIKAGLISAELIIIITILVTWYYGNRLQWHRRWLDYRRLAECLRHMRVLAPLGVEGPVGRPGSGIDVEGGGDWVNWYAWSLRRLLPLANRVVDEPYLAAVREAVRSTEIAEQARYHSANARRMAVMEHRIHHTGQTLFAITGGTCVVFLALYLLGVLPEPENPHRDVVLGLFTFFTALLPTLGAALGAIYAQGDFKTVAEQSERTARRLALIDKIMAEEPLDFARLADRVQKTSDVMMADLEEWQTVFRTRPLSLPA